MTNELIAFVPLSILLVTFILYWIRYYTYVQYKNAWEITNAPSIVYNLFPSRSKFRKLIKKTIDIDLKWFTEKVIHDYWGGGYTGLIGKFNLSLHSYDLTYGGCSFIVYGSLFQPYFVKGDDWIIVFSHDKALQEFFTGQGYYFVNQQSIVYGDLEKLENDLAIMRLAI